jgi:broad specificity phosphatase PhoE
VPTFLLIRHGQTRWDLAAERGLIGWGNDLVPLTPHGIEQIEQLARMPRLARIGLVLSSPMTRALQSAAILSRLLDVPLAVEFDLHEWVPDLTFAWKDIGAVNAAFAELTERGGEWPPGERRPWEPLSTVRRRMLGVLDRYREPAHVAVVTHGVAISTLTGRPPELAEATVYHL